jgi:hypothetical protein
VISYIEVKGEDKAVVAAVIHRLLAVMSNHFPVAWADGQRLVVGTTASFFGVDGNVIIIGVHANGDKTHHDFRAVMASCEELIRERKFQKLEFRVVEITSPIGVSIKRTK